MITITLLFYKMMKEIKKYKIVVIIIIATILCSLLFQKYLMKDYSRINNSTIDYVSAKVVEITSSELNYDDSLGINLGLQKIKVELLEGKNKGNTISLNNYLTSTHHVEVSKGTKIIITADEPNEIEPYYTVYSFDRSTGTMIFVGILFVFIVLIGRSKGLKSILALLYTLFIIIYLLLPAVFSGYSPVFMTILTIVLSTIVTLLLLNGQSQKTYSAILSTISGVMISGVFFYMMSLVLHLNGFSSMEAESLVLINQSTGLQIKDVLFAGILISSLGAIMDVGMSIVSSLYEIYYHKPDITMKELYHSGIEIGKDMIGTMTNTLILAFTGSAFISLLVLFSFQVDIKQLLNSDYLMIEFAQGLSGTLGIILTVPFASLISTYFLKNHSNS